jgi:hypothetical protein
MVEFDLRKFLFNLRSRRKSDDCLHLRNNVQRNIPNDHLSIRLKSKSIEIKDTYTSDLIDNLFNIDCSLEMDARRKSRASSGVKLCVAISS